MNTGVSVEQLLCAHVGLTAVVQHCPACYFFHSLNTPFPTHHDPRVFPLGELVEYPEEVDAGEHVPPAEGRRIADLQRLGRQLGLLPNYA